jgi:HEPN domain-containing protein
MYNKSDVSSWLEKAKDDILWAQSSLDDGFYSPTCFVSQQIAEKALKALVFSLQKNFTPAEIKERRTHNLNILIKIINKNISIPKRIKYFSENLNEFYLPTRYPDIPDPVGNYTKKVALEALKKAREIVKFVETEFKSS